MHNGAENVGPFKRTKCAVGTFEMLKGVQMWNANDKAWIKCKRGKWEMEKWQKCGQ